MSREGIAIVGAAGILPGAPDLDALWRLVLAGAQPSRPLAADRWSDRAGSIDPRGGPDRAFHDRAFSVADPELPPELAAGAEGLDRGHRLVLAAGAEAVRGLALPRARTGVMLAAILLPTEGSSALSRQLLGAAVEEVAGGRERGPVPDPQLRRGLPLAAELLARALDLGGGALSLDAACASSLHAVHLACEELRAGRADAMLVGGVQAAEGAYLQIGFTQLGALSPSGKPAPFDAGADGLVVGEGAVLFVLRRLSDAEARGEKILAVIRGAGVSTDVAGSLLSPASEGQLRAMRAAWDSAGLSPCDADLIECHGTGTPRGDAVELASLAELLRGTPHPPAIGSVKACVGHLLTGAGAAGLAKVLLALREKTLPPAAVSAPSPALAGVPVRWLPAPAPWERRAPGVPRRAAVSAFGFGGTNAHLILEEWMAPGDAAAAPARPVPVAIVGMAAHVGALQNLDSFRTAVLRGEPAFVPRPAERWRGLERRRAFTERTDLRELPGAWLSELSIPVGRFRIPPREIPSLLPQQLLALEVAADAVADAGGLHGPAPHLRTGVAVALELDLESTSFHLRWRAGARARALGQDESFAAQARDAVGPPLDASRTLGALGGIVAARVARELSLGGPSLTVSAGQAGGIAALELAAGALARREVDEMVVAAVDLGGDVRQILADDAHRPFSRSGTSLPFDHRADGPLPGEGGVALVLKRLDDALRDGDRVYAVLRGTGAASSYAGALERAYSAAGVDPSTVELVEGHGSGDPGEDRTELAALARFFGEGTEPRCALASVKSVVGDTGAAAALASVARAALCLFHEVLPAQPGFSAPPPRIAAGSMHVPVAPQPWVRDRAAGPRRAGVSAMGATCAHAVLEGIDRPASDRAAARARPLGPRAAAIFLAGEGQAAELLRLAGGPGELEELAARWHRTRPPSPIQRAVVAGSREELRAALASGPSGRRIEGELAFVFPGAGNLQPGMLGSLLQTPIVLRAHDAQSLHLATQLDPVRTAPRRVLWTEGWEADAARRLASETARSIAAQAALSVALADALALAGVRPSAVLGYSLGESAALFFTRAWRDRDGMLGRLLASPLFSTELAGPRELARRELGDADWRAAVLAAPAARVRQALAGSAALMVVNTPGECVVGGPGADVSRTAERLSCEPVWLPGLAIVHAPLLEKVADAYRELHRLPVSLPEGIRFYAASRAGPYMPDADSAADVITESACRGFDFATLIERAHADGVRIFVEPGPGGSCTRMIGRILEGREHLAVAAHGRDGFRSLLDALARLAEAGVPVDLDFLYGAEAGIPLALEVPARASVRVPVAGPAIDPATPRPAKVAVPEPARAPPTIPARPIAPALSLAAAIDSGTAAAHRSFLEASQRSFDLQRRALEAQQQLLARLMSGGPARLRGATATKLAGTPAPLARPDAPLRGPLAPPRSFDREACLAFARGAIASVLGPAYAAADGFPTRVRLPDEPLMLVDRILEVEGTPGVLGRSRIVTEHDVRADAFYLDGGRAPTCIAIEAGQADLFLSSWLGIDLETRGERRYRLLDATVTFHRDLPRPGETVQYDIRIDRFLRQGDTFLFFFGFEGTIGAEKLVTMRDGCAGFFSPAQLDGGAGIVGGPALPAAAPARGEPFDALRVAPALSLSAGELDRLRAGDASPLGLDLRLPPALRLPDGRMRLVDRILELDPAGGRHGKGTALGELDVRPDAWFLTSHFCDDPVMPGTLMYECCAHTARVLLLHLGLAAAEGQAPPDLHLAPVPGVEAKLRCRGQVTPASRKVHFRVDVRDLTWDPEPRLIADASMHVDGLQAVEMEGLSLRVVGLDRAATEKLHGRSFGPEHVRALSSGSAAAALGERFRPFDEGRFCARLPAAPFSFVDRLQALACEPLELREGARVVAEHEVRAEAFHLDGGRVRSGILLEAGLQPCGWLGAYGGVALGSEQDLVFRVLSGEGRVLGPAGPGPLLTRGRVLSLRRAGQGQLMDVSFESSQRGSAVHEGRATLGFFPRRFSAPAGVPGAPAMPALDGAGVYRVEPTAFFFAAHFKDDPVMPASLLLELAASGRRVEAYRFELTAAVTPESREVRFRTRAGDGGRTLCQLELDGAPAGFFDFTFAEDR